eukprot:scaffold22850_cov63-Phaeocystis_antarctica.AAC.2
MLQQLGFLRVTCGGAAAQPLILAGGLVDALRARWAVVEPLYRRPHRRVCNVPLACPRTRIICEDPRHDHTYDKRVSAPRLDD